MYRVSRAWLHYVKINDKVLDTWHSAIFRVTERVGICRGLPDRIIALERYISVSEASRKLMAAQSPAPRSTVCEASSQLFNALRVGDHDWCFQLFEASLEIDLDERTLSELKHIAGVPADRSHWTFVHTDWSSGEMHPSVMPKVKSYVVWAQQMLRTLDGTNEGSTVGGGLSEEYFDLENHEEGVDTAESWVDYDSFVEGMPGSREREYECNEAPSCCRTTIFDSQACGDPTAASFGEHYDLFTVKLTHSSSSPDDNEAYIHMLKATPGGRTLGNGRIIGNIEDFGVMSTKATIESIVPIGRTSPPLDLWATGCPSFSYLNILGDNGLAELKLWIVKGGGDDGVHLMLHGFLRGFGVPPDEEYVAACGRLIAASLA